MKVKYEVKKIDETDEDGTKVTNQYVMFDQKEDAVKFSTLLFQKFGIYDLGISHFSFGIIERKGSDYNKNPVINTFAMFDTAVLNLPPIY